MHEIHYQYDQAHGDAERNDAHRLAQRDVLGGNDSPGRHAHCNHTLQHRGLGQSKIEGHLRPLDYDELQGRAGTPEQRGDGQRNLTKLVAPEQGEAVVELMDQEKRVLLQLLVIEAGIRYVKVEDGRRNVEKANNGQGHFANSVDAGIEQRKIEIQQVLGDIGANQGAADDDAENDGADRQAFDPAVGNDKQAMRQVFGQDAVLGW